MINFNKAFDEALNTLNEKQKEAVDAIEGPVLVVAGPGTGKTQILAARIGNILKQTDVGPQNILALTYTDAGAIAMRKRLIKFIGAEAYKVNIFTFHGFANSIIQEHPYIFAKGALSKISELEEMQYLDQVIDAFPPNHPMKKWKQDNAYDRAKLKNLFDIIKKENWKPEEFLKNIDTWEEDMKTDPKYIYKRKYKAFAAGDLKAALYEKEVTKPMKLLKSAVAEYEDYQGLMKKNAKYDFNDMIQWVLNKFQDENFEDLLRDYQEQYQYILVDEYQDTNGSQNDLLFTLVNFWDNPNLFVVGDDDQSIYRFQGANIDNITDFVERYKDSIKIVELVNNYRSTQAILDASKTLIENNEERLVNHIDYINKDLIASHGEIIKLKTEPELLKFQNEIHQAVYLAEAIEKLKSQGEKLSETAIIYSKHKYVEDLMKYFDLKEIPYQVKKRKNILQSTFIKNLINMLVYIAEEADKPNSREDLLFEMLHYRWFNIGSLTIAKLAAENRNKKKKNWRVLVANVEANDVPDLFNQNKSIEVKKIAKFSSFIEDAIIESKNVTLQILIEKVIAKSGMLNWIVKNDNKVELMQELQTFYNFVKSEVDREPNLNVAGLVNNIILYEKSGIAVPVYKIVGDTDGVFLTTAHSSKGLEFDNVFLLNCFLKSWEKSGNSPFRFKLPGNMSKGDDGSDLQESRRLFYVAITRAKKNLFFCLPEQDYGNKEHPISQFVTEAIESGKIKNGKEEEVKIIDNDKVLEFQANIFEEPPAPNVEKIEKELIERALQKYQLSVTHLSSYLKCPRNFYFNNILRAPAAANHNMAFGTIMHSVLQFFFEKMRENNETFPELKELLSLFDWFVNINSNNLTDVHAKRFKEYSAEILPAYYEKYINTWHKMVKLEHNANNVVVNEIPLKGMLDKLEYFGNDVNVVDYKTGKHKKERFARPKPEEIWKDPENPTFEEEYGGDYWRQAVFYKILVDQDGRNKWNVVSSEFDFLEPQGDKKEFIKQKIDITDEDVLMVKSQIKDAWTRIQNHEFEGECKDIYCRWCGFVKENFDLLPEQTDEDGIENLEVVNEVE